MTPASCAASRASAICLAIGSASSRGIGPRLNPIRQRWPFDQFENKRTSVVGFFEAVDRRDVGMVQRSQNLCFTLKPCQPLRVGRERFGENLERHLALELGIDGLIHLSHAALADEGGHVVMAEPGADFQRHELLRKNLAGIICGSGYVVMWWMYSVCSEMTRATNHVGSRGRCDRGKVHLFQEGLEAGVGAERVVLGPCVEDDQPTVAFLGGLLQP